MSEKCSKRDATCCQRTKLAREIVVLQYLVECSVSILNIWFTIYSKPGTSFLRSMTVTNEESSLVPKAQRVLQ